MTNKVKGQIFNIKLIWTASIIIICVYNTYIVLAQGSQSQAQSNTTLVDSDVWAYLKYVAAFFLMILVYLGKLGVDELRNLSKTFNDLNLVLQLTNQKVLNIDEEISEIKNNIIQLNIKIEGYKERLLGLENKKP